VTIPPQEPSLPAKEGGFSYFMRILLTDSSNGTSLAGIIALVWILLVIYGIMAFFVPIYIYKTMRRTTQILAELRAWRATGSALPKEQTSSQWKREREQKAAEKLYGNEN
jgi:hypothetical protein